MGRGAEWKCARVRAVLGTDRKIREDPHWWPEEDFNSENNISVRHKFGFATARRWVSILGIRGEIWGGAQLFAIVSALPQAHTMFTAANITSRFVEFGTRRKYISHFKGRLPETLLGLIGRQSEHIAIRGKPYYKSNQVIGERSHAYCEKNV